MNKEERIMKRVQEHYDYLQSLGYEVVCTCLQGSQNYGLDEYSEEYYSDIDTKSIVLPTLKDFIMASPPVSKVEIMDNNEHAEVKDIRVMFDMFKKMNLSYIELLYSKYVYINPEWKDFIYDLFLHRDQIASYNRNQFLKCIAGMAMEKQKALCHPYPNLLDKIEKYGYDGKQLSHTYRLVDFIVKYTDGLELFACYKVQEPGRTIMMNYKKQLDANGFPLSKERAIELCDNFVKTIAAIKEDNLQTQEPINEKSAEILDDIKYEILKEQMRRELNNV